LGWRLTLLLAKFIDDGRFWPKKLWTFVEIMWRVWQNLLRNQMHHIMLRRTVRSSGRWRHHLNWRRTPNNDSLWNGILRVLNQIDLGISRREWRLKMFIKHIVFIFFIKYNFLCLNYMTFRKYVEIAQKRIIRLQIIAKNNTHTQVIKIFCNLWRKHQ